MNRKSLVDIAYDVLSEKQKPLLFKDLYDRVAKKAGFGNEERNEEKAYFYQQLTFDKRFVLLPANEENKRQAIWDLRIRHRVDEAKIDLGDAYLKTEIEEEDTIDNEIEQQIEDRQEAEGENPILTDIEDNNELNEENEFDDFKDKNYNTEGDDENSEDLDTVSGEAGSEFDDNDDDE